MVKPGVWGPSQPELLEKVQEMRARLGRRELKGSSNIAKEAAELLLLILKLVPETLPVQDFIASIKALASELISSSPQELALGNVIRRVLYFIRTSATEFAEQKGDLPVETNVSLHKLLDRVSYDDLSSPGGAASKRPESLVLVSDIKNEVVTLTIELISEVSCVYERVAEHAIEHIHAAETILTFGKSNTLLKFLTAAKDRRNFQVFVAETAPSYVGQEMALLLAEEKVDTTVITDAAVFALMARVNKVVVGTHAVLANGGLLAHSGAYNLALAASHYAVPFVVVTGLYKLSPAFAFRQESINEQQNPALVWDSAPEGVEVEHPLFDYVPPELVSLYVTNDGAYHPSYIYRLLSEHYRPEDTKL